MERAYLDSCVSARRFRYLRMTTNVAKLDLNQGQEPTPEEVKAEQALLDSLTILPVEVSSKLAPKKPKATKKLSLTIDAGSGAILQSIQPGSWL